MSGQGALRIDGARFEIGPCDVVAVVSRAALEIDAEEDLTLFSYSDRACNERLGF